MADAGPLRLTLDTNCIIYAAQGGIYGAEVAKLVSLARMERAQLVLTSAFETDQEIASQPRATQNLLWLERHASVLQRSPQPFRFDFSPLNDPGHVLLR